MWWFRDRCFHKIFTLARNENSKKPFQQYCRTFQIPKIADLTAARDQGWWGRAPRWCWTLGTTCQCSDTTGRSGYNSMAATRKREGPRSVINERNISFQSCKMFHVSYFNLCKSFCLIVTLLNDSRRYTSPNLIRMDIEKFPFKHFRCSIYLWVLYSLRGILSHEYIFSWSIIIWLFYQGLFSRITFNQPLFVGGVGEMKNVKNFLGVDSGLVGCVRRLEINDKYYNLAASMHGGDIVAGKDISKLGQTIAKIFFSRF